MVDISKYNITRVKTSRSQILQALSGYERWVQSVFALSFGEPWCKFFVSRTHKKIIFVEGIRIDCEKFPMSV